MKSDRKKRILAAILCMVMVLSSNISALAEGEVYADPDAVTQMETPEAVSETQPESAPQEPAAEEPPVSTEPAAPEAPAENNEPAAPETPAGNNEPAAPETPAENNEPATPETPETPAEEAPVFSEETELTKELRDASGKLVQKVTAKLPKGAFEAETSQIEMEVTYVDSSMENYIKGMMEKKLPTDNTLGDYFLYNIQFKVNGEAKESLEPIAITFEKSNLEIKDTKKANVFFFDPANPEVSGDKDELVEITQRSELLESLQAAGQSTATMEEDYDLSSIEIKEENRSGKIVLEGRKSTIYGCYVEKEPEQKEEASEEKPADIPVLNYEDDKVTVSVTAEEAGIIPEGAELKVLPITSEDTETKEQYQEVEKKIQEKVAEEEKEVAGFLAYDITFVDKDGNEMEPNGKVKVSMNYKKAELPQEVVENKATDAEVTVLHLEEDENGEVKQVVDMGAEQKATVDTLATTEGTRVQKVEVETESFSIFTITWGYRYSIHVKYVDENGNELSHERFQTDELSKELSREVKLSDYAPSDVEINGQTYSYQKALINTVSGKEAKRVRVKRSDGKSLYQYNEQEEGEKWKTFNYESYKRTVLLVYTVVEPLTTVETVDSSSQGVTMKMIDLEGDNDNKQWLSNQGNRVNFGNNSGYGSGNIKYGLLNNRITNSDGFPTVENSEKTLATLFAGAKEVNHLFLQETYNNEGYFEYSSFENYAYLGNNSNFKVYNQIGTPDDNSRYYYQRGNFMPYNDIAEGKFSKNKNLYNENGSELSTNNPRYNEKLYKTQGNNNYYFGMQLEANFTQPRNGQATHGNTTKDMIYEFNGDDDLWVFIDDVLVLDIGGVHVAHSGKINFSTGNVEWYDCKTGETPQKQSITLSDIFRDAQVLPSGAAWTEEGAAKEFKNNTFADYTTNHSFKMYYFERGAGASNLHVKFNIPTIPKETINVQKIVQDQTGQDVTYAEDIDFLFQLQVENQNYAGQKYDIIENEQDVGDGTTDAEGKFKLKHNQTARFSNIAVENKYQVKELGAYLDGYEVVVDKTTIWTPENNNIEQGAVTPEYTVGTQPMVVFINKLKHSATLNITKKLAENTTSADKEFQIELKLGDKLYNGGYKISGNTYTAEKGIIKLKADQTAVIIGLPYGVTFSARELLDGSYLPTYGITGEDVANIKLPQVNEDETSKDITSASAQINGSTCKLTVTNREIPVKGGYTSVSVEKTWKNLGEIPQPEYVDVYLYKDVNHNGKLDEGDVEAGFEALRLNKDNNWSGRFEHVPGDNDYVLKEVYPPGYELIKTESDNTFDSFAKVGDRETPNSNMVFNIGKNNFLLVKETGNKYFLWTPVKLNFDADDLAEITQKIDELGLNGAGNLKDNLEYRYGAGQNQGITLKETSTGWRLEFSSTNVWAMFWTISYHRTQHITLTNSLDKDAKTAISVEKQWKGDNPETRPENVTVQLYKNDKAEGASVELNETNDWKHEYKDLDLYTKDEKGNVTGKNDYTVKETMIGDKEVDESGRANGYQSSVEVVEEDGVTKFIITNAKDWQIVKISENSKDVTLKDALFKLTKGNEESSVYWGKSDEYGIVKWYHDATCENAYSGVFEDGTYSLKEIRSPQGYVVSEEIWTITIINGSAQITSSTGAEIMEDSADGKDTFYFKNTPIYDLPSTGGTGIFVYTIGGTLLLMAAALLIYKMKREEVLKG